MKGIILATAWCTWLQGNQDGVRLGIIKDKLSSETALLVAIESLGRVAERPDFWTTIANDANYTERHRGYCILALFKRHVRPGMTLGELTEILHGARWLLPDRVYRFPVMGGYVPVVGSPSRDSIFSLHLPGGLDQAVYLSVSGTLSADELRILLCNTKPYHPFRRMKVLDVWPNPSTPGIGRIKQPLGLPPLGVEKQ
jgi:hypothetical protein